MRSPLGAFIFLSLMLLFDSYVFQALKTVSLNTSSRTKSLIYTTYWTVAALVVISFLALVLTKPGFIPKVVRNYIFAIVIGLFLAKLTAVFFILVDDIRRVAQWMVVKLLYTFNKPDTTDSEPISRSVFLSWLGLAAGGGLFSSLLYGFSNKYNYDVKKVELSFENLPPEFKGLKIVQISDIHSGSFTNLKGVEHGVQKILKQNADIILFTGDLVNDMAIEMTEFKEMFSLLKAPMGVYSTLGNHDYGDYVQWPQNGISQQQNLENLKKVHSDMGWRLLMNEHVVLERSGRQIALLGIENWSSKARFPKHGRMDLAYQGAEKYPFKILMSHDPSHWEAQVQKEYPDIDLMLSGHTHGMQFGVEIPGFKWSPVQYMYKQWSGLYENEKQKLYVNAGFGFIGYPGRVGILPEITVIEFV
jgi:predicted MPP superfamily phosphohydrolase